jgi:D-alanyl-lipoteichoic acid acyltransferase DltB (MBOAT superfamily)
LAFAGQIYGDFAGYSGIAIGVALLLGFKIPANFNLPYLATSMVDHWQRWHISLSSWLREYLFFPLALRYPRHPYVAIVLTMTLAGLWHGASWTFVVFGVYHGVLLAMTEIVSEHAPGWVERIPERLLRCAQIALTFYFVNVAFVLFRAQSFGRAIDVLGAMHGFFQGPSAVAWPALVTFLFVALALIVGHVLSSLEVAGDRARILDRPRYLWPIVIACVAFSTAIGESGNGFIYFQF